MMIAGRQGLRLARHHLVFTAQWFFIQNDAPLRSHGGCREVFILPPHLVK